MVPEERIEFLQKYLEFLTRLEQTEEIAWRIKKVCDAIERELDIDRAINAAPFPKKRVK